nr:SUMF1/EgtB/PvdO family nonheme iron enzyme [Rhodoferax sp.]
MAPVAKFRPNEFGLYDMLGNVREWTADCYNANEYNRRADSGVWPARKTSDNKACSLRVLRGGSWEMHPEDIRAALRSGVTQLGRGNDVGFRLARMISPGS